MAVADREPSLRPDPTPAEGRLAQLVERAESLLISAVGLLLVALVLVSLLAVIWEVKDPLLVEHDFTTATLKGVNATFLSVILLELLHTTISRGPISRQLQEFLVIGITATVRHGLDLAATRGEPRDVTLNLAINAVAALLLVIGLWLVRNQLQDERQEGRPPRVGGA
jgi:phosphate-starvation-inducible protein E